MVQVSFLILFFRFSKIRVFPIRLIVAPPCPLRGYRSVIAVLSFYAHPGSSSPGLLDCPIDSYYGEELFSVLRTR